MARLTLKQAKDNKYIRIVSKQKRNKRFKIQYKLKDHSGGIVCIYDSGYSITRYGTYYVEYV